MVSFLSANRGVTKQAKLANLDADQAANILYDPQITWVRRSMHQGAHGNRHCPPGGWVGSDLLMQN